MNSIRPLFPHALLQLAAGLIGICLASGQVQSPSTPVPPTPAPPTLPFDDETNGFEDQEAFTKDREAFEEVETILKETVCEKSESEDAPLARRRATPAKSPSPSPACAEQETKGGL